MRPLTRTGIWSLGALLLAGGSTGLAVACKGRETSNRTLPGTDVATTPADSPAMAGAQIYTVRGKVVRILEPPVGPEVILAHEEIPDFIGRDGTASTMTAMTMGFPAGDELDLSGLEPGTPVEFRFAVDWDASRPLRLLSIEPLS